MTVVLDGLFGPWGMLVTGLALGTAFGVLVAGRLWWLLADTFPRRPKHRPHPGCCRLPPGLSRPRKRKAVGWSPSLLLYRMAEARRAEWAGSTSRPAPASVTSPRHRQHSRHAAGSR